MSAFKPLSLTECGRLALELRDRLEPASQELKERYGIELEAYARLSVLGIQLKHARQARDLDFATVAASLKAEVHAIRSIENLSPKLDYALLLEYLSLLDLSDWFAAWSKQNPDLIKRLSQSLV